VSAAAAVAEAAVDFFSPYVDENIFQASMTAAAAAAVEQAQHSSSSQSSDW
jgi:hypothetical protein